MTNRIGSAIHDARVVGAGRPRPGHPVNRGVASILEVGGAGCAGAG